ncbi:hypothetical protein [Clostridium diolis]|uniref:Uncharacterized protein n=1 Tax=Clostridium diolis TaxID=223919 RepID=A0AAV3W8N5_9CLOT|nr:hypothetical protein [Clostridium diolis]QES71605.1 hypothetical protein F3K33_01710 [Clostridium diolis]GEA33607.1 hypothetical protein CDIOL_45300 [Clostridium diolis]
MRMEELRKLINNIIGNEFDHISEFKEKEDFDSNDTIKELSEKVNDVLDKLNELLPDQQDLIGELDDLYSNYCTNACKYYFREGVAAGTTNLKFLEETKIMHLV